MMGIFGLLGYKNVSNNSDNACYVVRKKPYLIDVYEGIPDTLVMNMIAWLLLVLLFTVLRKQAWDYGRLALVSTGRNLRKQRWMELLYTRTSDARQEISTETMQNFDRGLFSWIWTGLTLSKESILLNCGPDAVHYLSFQKHLMLVLCIICLTSVVIVLPVNFHGNRSGDVNSFGHTTLANLDPESPWLWVHVIVSIAYVPIVVLIMRRSSGRNAFRRVPNRTVMISNISAHDRNETIIRNYLQELFPDIEIQDVQLAYNTKELMKKHAIYEEIANARAFCETANEPILARPKFFSCKKVDAAEYYKIIEAKLAGEVARLRASALNEPLSIAFVTVSTVTDAQHIVNHFHPGTYRNWLIIFAPSPDDIYWGNISESTSRFYVKWVFINTALFLVLFFLTTPAIIISQLDSILGEDGSIGKLNPLISESLPTLMLVILSSTMPIIVALSEKLSAHRTKSTFNYTVMTKTFGYLIFMIIILPSLGFTSAAAFLEWTIEEPKYRWDCIFLPDKGAFFVNYIITAAFIGTALELLRIFDLIVYAVKLLLAKSKAETPNIRKYLLIEFPFGIHYAWLVLNFTMTVVYSVACPLIAPFGIIYLGLKHFVDRHNIYYAYNKSNMLSQTGGRIHSTAVTLTKFSVVILLIIMAGFTTIRGKGLDARATVLILSIVITLVLFACMSPLKRCALARTPTVSDIPLPTPVYIPEVLTNSKFLAERRQTTTLPYGSDVAPHDTFFSRSGNASL